KSNQYAMPLIVFEVKIFETLLIIEILILLVIALIHSIDNRAFYGILEKAFEQGPIQRRRPGALVHKPVFQDIGQEIFAVFLHPLQGFFHGVKIRQEEDILLVVLIHLIVFDGVFREKGIGPFDQGTRGAHDQRIAIDG